MFLNETPTPQVDHWSLNDWANYYEAPRREEILNVISLEFSRTALREHVTSPALVRKLDWIDAAFPEVCRRHGQYPQTQYYCLMSAAGCYTDFHVDFGGTAVWYHVFRGRKVFFLIRPTEAHLAAYEKWICDPKQDTIWFPDVAAAGGPSVCARVVVDPGETFFIPSGWIHAVHTPVDSLVFGGNFLPGLATVDLQLGVYGIEAARQPSECSARSSGWIAATPRGATWIVRGDESSGVAAASTWIFRGDDERTRARVLKR